jgi:Leucine-rich repeat (LRR) protein
MDNEHINNNHIFGYANIEQLLDPQVITDTENIINTEDLGLFVNNANLSTLKAFLINNKLPDNLMDLECNDNNITKLPDLPNNLEWLSCINNQLTKLPYLPDSLLYLYCDDNLLTKLPELPDSIKEVNCADNNIQGEISYLPDTLEIYCCSNNQIQKLPE